MCIHTCMCICTYVLCSWTPEEGNGYPEAGVTGGYEPLYMGAGNQIWFLCKMSKRFNC